MSTRHPRTWRPTSSSFLYFQPIYILAWQTLVPTLFDWEFLLMARLKTEVGVQGMLDCSAPSSRQWFMHGDVPADMICGAGKWSVKDTQPLLEKNPMYFIPQWTTWLVFACCVECMHHHLARLGETICSWLIFCLNPKFCVQCHQTKNGQLCEICCVQNWVHIHNIGLHLLPLDIPSGKVLFRILQIFHSVATLLLVRQTWWPLFETFVQNVRCNFLTGWSCMPRTPSCINSPVW